MGGYICPRYMCILLLFGVVVFHRSMVDWGVKLNVIMTLRFGVVVFHRSMVDWRGGGTSA